jgi:biopolymer transport protein ExbD
MPRQKHRSQLDAIDEINMTPLIDLTFLLLIIFMITAPLLEYGIDVSPPEMNADELPEDNTKVVNLDENGEIVFQKAVMDRARLLKALEDVFIKNRKTNLLIRADGSRPYKEVINLMKTIKNAGFTNVSLVTRADDKD